MADSMLAKNVGGIPVKRLLIGGGAGVATLLVSDALVEKYITPGENETEADVEVMRGAVQIIGGVGLGYALRNWSPDLALGLAVGGVVGGGLRIAQAQGWDEDVRRWWEDSPSTTSTTSTQRSGGAIARRRGY